MSITINDAPGGLNSASTNINLERTYKIGFTVETTVRYGPGAIRNAVIDHLGGMGATYAWGTESDTLSYLQNVSVISTSEDGFSWSATASYGATEPAPENPLDEPPIISIDYVVLPRLFDRDRSGSAVINSAKDIIDPPIEREESLPIISVSRNEASYPLWSILQKRDTINNSEWNGFPSGTVKQAAPRAQRQFSPEIGFYYRVDYEFMVNPDGWDAHILDNGVREINASGIKQDILIDGQKITSPHPLNGSGLKLAEGEDPVFLTFERYEPTDFSFWNITLA